MSQKSHQKPQQMNFISPSFGLMDQLNPNHPLLLLSKEINWQGFESELAPLYSRIGRKAKPIRLMVGLMMLKQLEDLSDEKVVQHWIRDPYMQAFCDCKSFQWNLPCDSSDLTYFRKRIGEKGVELILKASMDLFSEEVKEETEILMDTTVQEKNITYPTDSKLALKMIRVLHKIGDEERIKRRRSYIKELKELRLTLRHFRHVKKRKNAKKALRRVKTIARVLLREAKRKLPEDRLSIYKETFDLFAKVLGQKRKSKKKIYSLHEPKVYCMAKGKDHKQYEYGSKVGVAVGKDSGVVMGVVSFSYNRHDSRTIAPLLAQIKRLAGMLPESVLCDRGYRGKKKVAGVTVRIPGSRSTEPEIERLRFRKRAGIEGYIGQLKHCFRMNLNRLKGLRGDKINAMMAGTAFNFSKWMLAALLRLFFVFMLFFAFFRSKIFYFYKTFLKKTNFLILN